MLRALSNSFIAYFMLQELAVSAALHSILTDMCEERPALRLTLTQIMQNSSAYSASHMTETYSAHIMRMYELVFGSAENVRKRKPQSYRE